ncbi:hypothetical protein [Noviluteimonas gilva]|uniref:Uncharacterized protein n=1 Tax=Noviluteimonas gilva TaxID=2682097 RepID=A0A7C9HMG2_9GAMM|nr:hypothetical protein [Lysobacter gilvus]MUV14452.1 hypothetical protein [Lysobacter gilvus]
MTPECHLLRDELLAYARAMLDRFGGFQPFGGYAVAPDRVTHVGFAPAMLAAAPCDRTLARELAEIDASAVAHALVFDIHLHVPHDGMASAIRLHLSHVEGRCMDLFIPYRARKAMPTLYGSSFVLKGTSIGFPRR